MDNVIATVFIGSGATLFTDAWALLRKALFGTPLPDYAMVGRWFGHMVRGRFLHPSIAASPAIRGERLIGWTAHYVIGVLFAALLVAGTGGAWTRSPTPGLALLVGGATIAAPWFVMQPAMGSGVAASRTRRPNIARLQSLATHFVFGLGLYASGLALRYIMVERFAAP